MPCTSVMLQSTLKVIRGTIAAFSSNVLLEMSRNRRDYTKWGCRLSFYCLINIHKVVEEAEMAYIYLADFYALYLSHKSALCSTTWHRYSRRFVKRKYAKTSISTNRSNVRILTSTATCTCSLESATEVLLDYDQVTEDSLLSARKGTQKLPD